MDNTIILYHGSNKIIKKPVYCAGKRYNDYGSGFYCTQDLDLAKEWAVSENQDGYANEYCLDMTGLSVLDLSKDNYGILHWLTVLLQNRLFDIQSDFGEEARRYLIENFDVEYQKYDVIIGYRADDSYFSFAQDFLNNAISLRKLSRAMHLGKLGLQTVLKSERAFAQITFQQAFLAENKKWMPQKMARDSRARQEYFSSRKEPRKPGDIYMLQILDEEMKADDPCIR